MSSDESEASDSESDEDLEDGWAVAPAARTASRPRRQAAQKANANIKVCWRCMLMTLEANRALQAHNLHLAGHTAAV